jgi:hypothetical protein
MEPKPYTTEQARMAADNLDEWCDEEERSAQKNGEPLDVEEERIEAASWREYAAMKEAMAEIAEHENGSFCGHYTLNECHARLVSLARRFVADQEG